MKLIISKNTVSSINAEAFIAFAPAILELDPSTDSITLAAAFGDIELDDTHANHSVSETEDDYVVEVNDELLFKYMRMYAKIARFITPFIKPVMTLVKALSDDLNDIQRFVNQKK